MVAEALGRKWRGRDWIIGSLQHRTGLLIGIVTFLIVIIKLRGRLRGKRTTHDPKVTDPPLLKKYSSYDSYHVEATGFTYSKIRTVYRAHPQAAKLPTRPTPLPLLVFIHGLGGCGAQFAPLLTSLINVGPCLIIDLPGCGLSDFAPHDWEAYTTGALVQLLAVIVERYRDADSGQGVVLLAHSMGCSLSALLASRSGDIALSEHILGLVAMCPRASDMTAKKVEGARRLLRVPNPIFDLLRRWDRRGGPESHSVQRMAGSAADAETKKLQLRYNTQSKTPVWRRMTYGLLPKRDTTFCGLPRTDTWTSLQCPVYLIAGESDSICPPSEVHMLAAALRHAWTPDSDATSADVPLSAASSAESTILARPTTRALKTTILPAPASHALPYSPATVRTLSGLIQHFLATHIDPRLSLGWQLTYLADSGKWDVKNLEKWQKTSSISGSPIGQRTDGSGEGVFLAMKTMREVDDVHTPKNFVKQWSGKVKAIVDISHESPVYDPRGLEEGGIEYHKCPSVSKQPPIDDEVDAFERVIDQLRGVSPLDTTIAEQSLSRQDNPGVGDKLIVVHCHYGFNRTGFFIICYLVDRMGWKLQDAIDEFARCRPPGVKHNYFIDALLVRYCGKAQES